MAQWQLLKKGVVQPEPWFDDGILARPGEPDFTTEHVDAEAKRLKCDGFSYVGNSTVVSARMDDAIDERVNAIIDDEENPIGDPVVARKMVLTDLGLRDA